GQAGIAIYNSHFIDPNLVLFSQNEIYLDKTVWAFHVYNSSNLRINDNTITELAPYKDFYGNVTNTNSGIHFAGAKNCQVRDNIIIGAESDPALSGTQVSNSPGTVFCCNTINATRRGMGFAGMCDDTRLRATDFSNIIVRGLHLAGTAKIGKQYEEDEATNTFVYHGNRWIGGASAGSAQHDGGTELWV